MASTSVSTIRRMKEIYAESVAREYGAPAVDARDKVLAAEREANKRLVKEIEDLILAKHPHLERRLRCERGASEASYDSISLSFGSVPASAEINQLALERDMAKESHRKALQCLDDWEMQALQATAERDKLPEFRVVL